MSATSRMLRTENLSAALAVALCVWLTLLTACGTRTQQQPAAPAAPESTAQTGTTEPAAPAGPALAVTEAAWAPDALEKLVAPIALYPDQLVGQILAASVNSQEVLDGGNWLLQNENLKGDQLDAAAQKAGLGPAMSALVHFPTVVDMMCQQIDWTRQLGSAFTSDQKGVLDAVQRLRAQAAQVGNLKSTPQQKVETKVEDNKTVIVVQPANPQVVYVPQYNPQVVYTTPPPPPASTEGTVSTGAAVATGLIAFGVGALVGSAIASNNCYPHWGAGAVYVGPRPFYPPAYVYRPAYGPAFRPATGYVPPPGYRYNYNSGNVNVNRNVNVNVNNNYFNQFNHNQNLNGATQNNINGATRNSGWKGQSSYAGAHATPAETARFNQATGKPANSAVAGGTPRGYQNQAGGAGSTRNPAPANSPNPSVGGTGSTRNPALASNRAGPAGGASPAGSRTPPSGGGPPVDRGYGGSTRGGAGSGVGATPAAASSRGSSSSGGNTAFSGASNSGSGGFERAASARGNASAGGSGRAAGGRRH